MDIVQLVVVHLKPTTRPGAPPHINGYVPHDHSVVTVIDDDGHMQIVRKIEINHRDHEVSVLYGPSLHADQLDVLRGPAVDFIAKRQLRVYNEVK